MWKWMRRLNGEPPPADAPEPQAPGVTAGSLIPLVGEEPGPDDSIAEIEVMASTAIATITVAELTQEDGAERLSELLLEMAETGVTNFVLDMQNVQYMDTACLGCLVQALNDLAARGGGIALANPNHSVHYVFRLTRLDRVFRICSNVMAALEAVEKPRQAG
jgi:anti-sigma B factor antagonist